MIFIAFIHFFNFDFRLFGIRLFGIRENMGYGFSNISSYPGNSDKAALEKAEAQLREFHKQVEVMKRTITEKTQIVERLEVGLF